MDYTPEQRDAIYTHDCNLIVTAGAGSGKTRVLVDRFVALLEAHHDWPLSSLVAITFTEKAAREMRDRVRQAIERHVLDSETGHDSATIQFWRNHQAALDSARIGTIHSLCATILRANAAEIGIDPRFNVLDEVEAAILAEEAVEQSLNQLVEANGAETTLLLEYEPDAVRNTLREWVAMPPELLPYFECDADVLAASYRLHVQAVIERLCQDQAFIEAINWQPENGWPSADDKLMPNWELVIARRSDLSSDAVLDVLNDWTAIKLTGGTAANWGGKLGLDTAKAQLRLIRERITEALDEIGEPFGDEDRHAAGILPLWGNAIQRAQQIYADLKTLRRALDFDDLERLARMLLRSPKVAKRYRGAEFQHILVDEFQDTNDAQREIIYALSGLDRPGSLFVVGDDKQSIYEFRGADVSVFDRVRQDILNSGGREINLNTSFRSHDQLVNGFNAIFGGLLVRGDGLMAAYQVELGVPMQSVRAAEADQLSLELILVDKEKADEDRRSADDLRRWEAWTLAQRLKSMVEAEYLIWDKQARDYRPLTYGDVGILFQSSNSMPLVEEILKAVQVPYITLAGKGYYAQREVWDLLNLLRALYNPADDLSLASALRSPLYNLSDDDLLALRLQPGESLWAVLMAPAEGYDPIPPHLDQITFARKSLKHLHEIAGRVTIAELLGRILNDTGYLAVVSGLPDGERRCGNVEKLVELARRSGRIGLSAFTAYLEDLSEREIREGEALVEAAYAVQLMTVHASKGLEFPVVCLFDASWEGGGHEPILLINPDPAIGAACVVFDDNNERIKPFAFRRAQRYMEQRREAERLRLLYVGMTRAQDYLIISGRVSKSSSEKDHWLGRLSRVLDISNYIDGRFSASWGDILIRVPEVQPSPEALTSQRDYQTAWDQLGGKPIAGVQPIMPPLLQPVEIDHHAPARTLTATMIAALGESKAIPDVARFRHHVLGDAPLTIQEVTSDDGGRAYRRAIGDMVHRALQWGRLPGNTPDLQMILQAYGWKLGITDSEKLESAVNESINLLSKTEASDITRRINRARDIYRELPFAFQYRGRTINGIIDVLFYLEDEGWSIVDYKTSFVHFTTDRATSIANHSTRYYAQVGIYASAVEQLIGQTPTTHLHYIRYAHTIDVPTITWQTALRALDEDIVAALQDESN